MAFCTKCGQTRSGSERFCTACGAPFSATVAPEQAAAQSPAATDPEQAATDPEQAAPYREQTAAWAGDQPAGPEPEHTAAWAGHEEGTDDDPFAGLYADRAADPVDRYRSARTLAADPSLGPVRPDEDYAGPGQGHPRPPRPRRMRMAITVAAIVAIVAAGGGVIAWAQLRHKGTSAAAATSSLKASAVTPTTTVTVTPSAAAPAAPSPSATVTATPAPGAVAVAAGVAQGGDEPAIVAFLDDYFAAINAHSYARYSALLSPAMRQQVTAAQFKSGYASTADSGETLVSLKPAAGGQVAATTTFISHQSPSNSATNSSCTSWRTTLFLLPQGGSFVIEQPPADYRAQFKAC
jgi:hypothetical protein